MSATVDYVWHLPALSVGILLQSASHDPAALAIISSTAPEPVKRWH